MFSASARPVCACSRALQPSRRAWKVSQSVTASALRFQRSFHAAAKPRDAATSESASFEPSSLKKSSQEVEKQKNETTAVRALDRLSSALRIKEAGNERHHKLSRIRGGGFWADRHASSRNSAETISADNANAEKRMEDSYVEVDLPFESEPALLEQYIGAFTSVRIGRIMEDLDSLAASVAYKHVLSDSIDMRDAAKAGLYVVTAAVDRLDMLRPLSPDEPEDLRLSGHVYSVGRSTMEITVRLQSISRRKGLRDTPETILLGRFTMACRDKETGKAKAVPQLITEGDDEVTLEQLGKEQREKKLAQMKQSLQVVPPNEGESKMLHRVFTQFQDYYKDGANVPAEVVWMRKGTQLSSALMAHPQERNVHGNVFGGYLMRLAYEAAYSTGCLFARSPIVFLALDELAFKAPVTVGSLLQLTSAVTFSPIENYSEHKSFQVSVEAATINLHTGEKQVTNNFHYTFSSKEPLKRFILPETYLDGLSWLESMRRREVGRELRQLYAS